MKYLISALISIGNPPINSNTTVSEKATRMMSSNPPLILNFMCLASYDGRPTEVVSHEKWNIKFEKL